MRLFDACVKPSAIFAMHVLPLRVADTNRIAATERRMKRCIVDWTRHADDDWPTTMRHVRDKVAYADSLHPTKPWVESIWSQQWICYVHLCDSVCAWPRLLATWQPNDRRPQDRTHKRWDDHINHYCRNVYHLNSWLGMTSANALRGARDFSTQMSIS